MTTLSAQPRRQRKALFEADTFERRRRMSVALSKELRTRYGRRSLPVRKGDTVRILSGSYVGREERVAKVDRRSYSLTLDNVTGKTADAKLKPLPIRPSHLLLTRLNLSDPWRRRVLKVPESEAPSEEGAEPTEAPPTPAPSESAPAPKKTTKPKATEASSP
ncbi:MAG TPA: 50S ribosomal protein L24 [Thermoplasmata archaeon]|nr:50S ribosomal protein L24 [Thermoplasmata archaeon]